MGDLVAIACTSGEEAYFENLPECAALLRSRRNAKAGRQSRVIRAGHAFKRWGDVTSSATRERTSGGVAGRQLMSYHRHQLTSQGTSLDHSDESRELLQRRVSLAGFFGLCMGWGFVLFRLLPALTSGELSELIAETGFWFHVAAGGFAFVMWLSCRRGVRSRRFSQIVEAVCIVGASACYAAMGALMTGASRPDYLVLVALSYLLLARAAYVPSTAKRTALLSTVVALPPLIMTYYVMINVDLDKWVHIVPELGELSQTEFALTQTVFILAFWICAVALCTLTSRVVYGLRKEMHDARKLGQYTLEEKLGEGGMGEVYRARHSRLRRPTAVKLLPASRSSEQAVARFEAEVQLTAELTHPNTITIYDYGRTADGVFYYAMELLPGANLAQIVTLDGPQPAGRVIRILEQAAGALQEAHTAGLIHRDIKPANIMLTRQGIDLDAVKVLDFGLVRPIDRSEGDGLTLDGSLLGTPLYMAPESIVSAKAASPQSDIYALGAVGYFLLSGKHVFSASNVVELCAHHLHTVPKPVSEHLEHAADPALTDLIMQCLAKEPDERPAGAFGLLAQLRRCVDRGTWTSEHAADWWRLNHSGLRRMDAPTGDASAGRFTLTVAS